MTALTTEHAPPSPAVQKQAMRNAILAQCAGALSKTSFDNGFLLLYLAKLGFTDKIILLLIASRTFLMMLMSTPMAFVIDRRGIKRIGYAGTIVTSISFAGITVAACFPPYTARWVAATSIIVFNIGLTLFTVGWFPLLKGFLPQEATGRFFGLLRLSWQTTALVFVMLYSLILQDNSQLWLFQAILGVMLVGIVVKLIFYWRMPEFFAVTPRGVSVIATLRQVLPAPSFMPFCAYSFVLMLFTTAMPTLFNLVEKEYLNMGDNTITWLGGVLMAGAMFGYPLGGFIVDRIGTKMVFLICHLGFMVVACLFPLRDVFADATMVYLVAMHAMWGMLFASSSIALSTELFAVMPAANRTVATSVWWSLSNGGGALSGFIAAGAVSIGFLNETWTLLGHRVSQYDTIILVFGVMTGLMAVTLGLVPSVIGQPQWMPRSH